MENRWGDVFFAMLVIGAPLAVWAQQPLGLLAVPLSYVFGLGSVFALSDFPHFWIAFVASLLTLVASCFVYILGPNRLARVGAMAIIFGGQIFSVGQSGLLVA